MNTDPNIAAAIASKVAFVLLAPLLAVELVGGFFDWIRRRR